MPEEEAKYHLKRCVDSGLWVPDASKVDQDAESSATAEAASAKEEEGEASSPPPSSSAETEAKPTVSTEDVD